MVHHKQFQAHYHHLTLHVNQKVMLVKVPTFISVCIEIFTLTCSKLYSNDYDHLNSFLVDIYKCIHTRQEP